MTQIEKYVITRLCAKILAETDFYETDNEIRDLINWIILGDTAKRNNNQIRNLITELKKTEENCKLGIEETRKNRQKICEQRQILYEEQQEIRYKQDRIERSFKCNITK